MAYLRGLPRREVALVGAAVALGLAIRLAYVLITADHDLKSDEVEYHVQGSFFAAGKWFWGTTPYGIPHPTLWKAPGYPAWVGVWYSILGPEPDRVLVVQALVAPVTVVLTWLLGRRLFGPGVGIAAAFIVAAYPFAWQFDVRLFPEVLVTPLTLVVLLLVLERPVTFPLAAGVGALCGGILLIRPSAVYFLPALAAAWIVAARWRRGLALTVATLAATALVIAPWTYRNYDETDSFIPISLQDAAAYGTFNEEAAKDPVRPWAWRPETPEALALFDPRRPLPEGRLRTELQDLARDYIEEHPESVPKAFFWNGLSRFWDVRRPARVLEEVPFQARSRTLTKIGLAMYWVLLPLALAGLWFARSRRGLVVPLLVLAVSASLVHTTLAITRYRAPLEPVIAVLACSAVATVHASRRSRAREPVATGAAGPA